MKDEKTTPAPKTEQAPAKPVARQPLQQFSGPRGPAPKPPFGMPDMPVAARVRPLPSPVAKDEKPKNGGDSS